MTLSRVFLSASVLLLTACATRQAPVVNTFTLIENRAATPLQTAGDTGELRSQFRLLSVQVPERLNSEHVVVRDSSGELFILQNQQWAAALPGEIRNAISIGLTQRLPGIDVTTISANQNLPVYRIKLNVQQFETIIGERTRLLSSWSVGDGADGAETMHCVADYQTPSAVENRLDIGSYRQLISHLLADMTTSIRRYQTGGMDCR